MLILELTMELIVLFRCDHCSSWYLSKDLPGHSSLAHPDLPKQGPKRIEDGNVQIHWEQRGEVRNDRPDLMR